MIPFIEKWNKRYASTLGDQPYLYQIKAKLLGAFSLLVILFVPPNVTNLLWLQPPGLHFRLAFNAVFLLASATCLWLLTKGQLRAAGNSFAILAIIPVHLLLLFVPEFREPVSAGISLFGYDILCLLLALVFGTRPVAFAVLAVILGTQIAFHVLLLQTEPIPGSLLVAGRVLLRDGILVTIFVFVLGIILAAIVETAHRRDEEALRNTRATNENLEQLVAERTNALEVATARAEEASRAKGEFLANMSHEIRTPLHGIVALSELLVLRRDLPEEASEKARIISESGELLLKQIGEVLDLSKIEAGQLELELASFDPSSLCRDCVSLMESQAQSCGVELLFRSAPELPSQLIGDSFRIRQILLNLLSNAIKFTPKGGEVRVSVATGNPESGERLPLRIDVEDTGCGMDSETRERIFQRFQQAGPSTARTHGGTGLGLSICLHLAELMGGKLEVQSTPACGSHFSFAVALEVPSLENAQQEQQPEIQQKFPLLVLVADDNMTNRKIIGLQLERLGCQFVLTKDGRDMLDSLEQGILPDVIFADCEMPILDGLEATRILRSWASDPRASEVQKRASKLPVVAVTAAASAGEKAACLAAGMTDFLAKPLKMASLSRVLQTVMPAPRSSGKE